MTATTLVTSIPPVIGIPPATAVPPVTAARRTTLSLPVAAPSVLADPDAALDGSDQPQRLVPTDKTPPREVMTGDTQRGAGPDPSNRPDDPPYKVIGGIVYLTRASR